MFYQKKYKTGAAPIADATPYEDKHAFGFVTAAFKNRDYLEMAVDMTLSLREFHQDPVCLLCDPELHALAKREYENCFSDIICVEERLWSPIETNFLLPQFVPYARAIYLDADILLLSDLDDYIALNKTTAISMIGEYYCADTDRRHQGRSIARLLRKAKLEVYFKNHTGMMAYQRKAAAEFFEKSRVYWRNLHAKPRVFSGIIGNELGFGLAANEFQVSPIPEPTPILWNKEIRSLNLDSPQKPLLHMIGRPEQRVLDQLMDTINYRRQRAGLSTRSTQAWVRKATRCDSEAAPKGFNRVLGQAGAALSSIIPKRSK